MQRTIKALKEQNQVYGIVERFIHNRKISAGIRSDLFGLFDVLNMSPYKGIIGIQVCGADFAAHYRKITIEHRHNALMWLSSGGKIELWGWRLLVEKRGSKRRKWMPRIISITEKDLMSQRCREAA